MKSTTVRIPKIRRFAPYLAGGLVGIVLTAGTIFVAQHLSKEHPIFQPSSVVQNTIPNTSVPPVPSSSSAAASAPVVTAPYLSSPSIPTSSEKPPQQLSPDNYAGNPDTAVRKLRWAISLVKTKNCTQQDCKKLFTELIKEYEPYPRIVSESLYYLSLFNIQTHKPKKMNSALSLLERLASAYNDQPVIREGKVAELVSDTIYSLLCGEDFDSVTGETITISYQPNYDLARRYAALFRRVSPSLSLQERIVAILSTFQSRLFVFPEELFSFSDSGYPYPHGENLYPILMTTLRASPGTYGGFGYTLSGDPLAETVIDSARPEWIQQLFHTEIGLSVSEKKVALFTHFYKAVILHHEKNPNLVYAHYAVRIPGAPEHISLRDLFAKMQMNMF